MTLSRGFITRLKPINGITPFTYRDGLTFLEILEKLAEYIEDKLIYEVNEVIAVLIKNGDEMADSFKTLLSETNSVLTKAIAAYKAEIEAAIADQKARADEIIEGFDTRADEILGMLNVQTGLFQELAETVNQYHETTSAAMNAILADIDEKVGLIDDRLNILEVYGANPRMQYVTLPEDGTYTLEINPLYNGHPIEYVITNNSSGTGKINMGAVTGVYKLNSGPNAVTRLRLMPNGSNGWKVDPYHQIMVENMRYRPMTSDTHRKTIMDDGRYNAFPSVAVGRNGAVLVSYNSQTDHFTPGYGRALYSSDNGKTWGNVNYPSVTNGKKWGVIQAAGTNYGFTAMLGDESWGKHITRSSSGLSWSTPQNLVFPGIGSSLTWVDDGTADGLLIFTTYWGGTAELSGGIRIYMSQNNGVNWQQRKILPQMPVGNATSNNVLSESSIIRIGDELVMLIRYEPDISPSANNGIMMTRSKDWGYTWTPLQKVISWNLSQPHPTVMPDGSVILPLRAHNINVTENAGTCYAISNDGCHSFTVHYDTRWLIHMYGEIAVLKDNSAIFVGANQITSTDSRIFACPVVPVNKHDRQYNDTGWIELPINTGFTGTGHYRVVNGIVYLNGTITKTAGNVSAGLETVATLPNNACPDTAVEASVGSFNSSSGIGVVARIDTSGLLRVGQSGTDSVNRFNLKQIPPYPSKVLSV